MEKRELYDQKNTLAGSSHRVLYASWFMSCHNTLSRYCIVFLTLNACGDSSEACHILHF
jgi:hypothetical protein